MSWPQSCTILHDEPLAKHTSFRIGGPAEWFVQPNSLDELLSVLREAFKLGLPVTVLGGGSNTLAADRGLRGLVINLGRGFKTVQEISHQDELKVLVRCGAALRTQRLVYLAAKYGWADLERLAGLPGQLGGAIAMNAQSIGRFVHSVRMVLMDGTVKYIVADQLAFGYRYTALEPGLITEVTLQFSKIDAEEAALSIHKAMRYRNSTQELQLPSAGCAFMNPAGVGAGRLIDESNLKGVRIGDAQISHRHANFIVNLGQATCGDVLSLIEHVQSKVDRNFSVKLRPEVRMIGQRL